MMNSRIFCAAVIVLAGLAASASAAERSISKATLSSMGLSAVQQMSDSEGLAVRGKGTSAAVWGQGTANFVGGNTSTNGYAAASSHHHGSSLAVGANVSVAGVVSNHGFILAVAGGASVAYAK